MQEKQKRGKAALSGMMLAGFCVQILLGMIWLCGNFTHFQDFGESRLYLQAGSNGIDDYMGFLYFLAVLIAKGLGKILPVPYYCFLYVSQLAGALAAAHFFFMQLFTKIEQEPVKRKRLAFFGAFSLLTVPMAMQCHLAVLPNSAAQSALLAECGVLVKLALGPKSKFGPASDVAKMGIWWFLATFFLPEYRLIGAVPVLLYLILLASGQERPGKGCMRTAVIIAIGFMMAMSIGTKLFTSPGVMGRMHNTLEAAAFRRFAWDDFGEFYASWPEELRYALDQEEITEGNWYPQEKMWILGEKIDNVYGTQKARSIYGQVARIEAKVRFGRNFREITKDFICYALSPATQLFLMEGRGQITVSGNNYEIMRNYMPRLTSVYMRYGCLLFIFGGILLLPAIVFTVKGATPETRKYLKQWICFTAVLIAGIALWYTMQGGGMMDYKNSVPATTLWTVLMILAGLEISK